MNGLSQLVRSLGAVRLAIIGGVALAMVGLIMFMASRIAAPGMALLYSGLELQDSSAITAKLEQMNVPFELRNQGVDVLVPEDQVLKLRMSMAQEGLPVGGSVGYEIFDKSQSFGTTSFVQDINHLRALEGELARTIGTLGPVGAARVHLVLPKREVFSREKREASASILLKLKNARTLAPEQVAAIQNLVAAAVPQLKPSHISIVDDRGNLLAEGSGGDESLLRPTRLDSIRISAEDRIKRQVEALLERSVGPGNVRAEITVDMDFDQQTTTSETYDPDGQVVRSTQTVEEQSSANEGNPNGDAVTVANNLPEAGLGGDGETTSSSANSRLEETTNYEISKTVKTEVREAGRIRRLSVAVLVNGLTTKDADGNTVYTPRNEQELEQLAALVRSAVGYDEERGDTVKVVNMRFSRPELEIAEGEGTGELFLGLTKSDIMRIVQLIVLAVVAILALVLVVRPLLNRALSMSAPALPGRNQQAIGHSSQHQQALTGPAGEGESSGGGGGSQDHVSELDELIDISVVDGRVKASSVKRVGEIVDKHPEEAIAILRNWLYQEA